MAQILVVEDDESIGELVRDLLMLSGYEVAKTDNGKTALELIKKNSYDLIILDVMLPEINGFEIMEKIKKYAIPVLFLSAKDDAESVIKGLKLGAQDYIRKPFNRLELLARIEIILKRETKEKMVYTFKELELNTLKRKVFLRGEEVELRPKEYELLELFMKNVDIAFTREELLDKVWGITSQIETRTVDYHIQQLRKKLDLKEEIVTLNRVGYRLERRK